MKVSIYTASFDETSENRSYDLIKTLDLEFLPPIGSSYIDVEDKKVYSLNAIFFTDHNITAIAKLQGEERFDNYSQML
ncbi:MAG: hypothetical protein ABIN89_09090 [Chitinophagaceae bacterium]